ncbi:CehA/McbA family metallohydrolase [Butyricicoccus sp.]|uniref:CehA/McbA family metallohydrolase n=1 Tax=Butyricicoccus sp. TaxID=2049021 RepID=UPI003F183199
MNWYPIELHTHTQHSDGDFTVSELVKAAKQRGFAAIACTDHNTCSGLRELHEAARREQLVGISGIEWTTYWGHMLVLNEQGYTDWRGVRPEDMDGAIAAIHANHGMVGIAHPFALSNPVNTGYHWEFRVSDWDAVDFLEVWSRDYAPSKIQSLRAMELWEQLLNRRCRMTATSGRDWHREDDKPYGHTFVGVEGKLTTESVLHAVHCGRVCLAAGPLLTMQGNAGGKCIQVGDTVCSGEMEIDLQLDSSVLENDWDRTQVLPEEICLVHNRNVILRCPLHEYQQIQVSLPAGWLRADLIGTYYGRTKQCLAFTNPIYIS